MALFAIARGVCILYENTTDLPVRGLEYRRAPRVVQSISFSICSYCKLDMVFKRLQQLFVLVICLLLLVLYHAYYNFDSSFQNLFVSVANSKLLVVIEEDASFTTFFRPDDHVISVPSIPIDCSRVFVVMTELNAVSRIDWSKVRVELECHKVVGRLSIYNSVQWCLWALRIWEPNISTFVSSLTGLGYW
jgi:hypothetical protein